MATDKNLRLSNLERYKNNADAKYAAEFVAKESGKGLSTCDFTQEHKTKLESLNPTDEGTALNETQIRACFPTGDSSGTPDDPGNNTGHSGDGGDDDPDATDDDIRDLFN